MTDLTPSSSTSAKDQASLTLVGTVSLGTGISSASESTQEVLATDVYVQFLSLALYTQADLKSSVYTTLTTCPVTSLVTSGSTSFEEITTTISTVTRTSTSTLCTKCVAPPSKPAVVSLTVSATAGTSSTLEFPGYGIVPSPTSTPGSPREEIFSNATSSTIPVYTAALLGNAYGGGFVNTPSVYVTKLPYPNGPSSGVPPGYGSESSTTIIGNNITAVFIGFETSSTSAAGLQSTTAAVGTISSNISALFGSLGASTVSATTSENEGSTPTVISLSPFGGEVGQESASTAIPTMVSVQLPSGSSLAAVGLSTSLVHVQVAVVGSSTTSIIGSSGVIEASVVPVTTVTGVTLSPTFSSSGVNIEPAPAGSSTSGESGAIIVPSLPAEQSAGPLVTLAVGPSVEQIAVAGQPVASTPTSIIVANGTSISTVSPSPIVSVNGQIPAAGQPVASTQTPIIVANGTTALAVIPSPVVGANGLTSLAVFSTPIAPAAGLTMPAVLLTPIVGANGLTSLAVVATPVVGANGLTSLAIGFETESIPAAGQSNSAPTPVEGFVVVQPPAFTPQFSGSVPNQVNVAASGVANVVLPSESAGSPVSGDIGSGNYSIHVLLNPTAVTQFQGSAVRLSLGFGVGLFGLIVFLVLL